MVVQSVGLSDSRFHAFLSFSKQSRPIYPPARPYPGTISIVEQISDAIRREDPYDIEVEREPLVRAHLPPLPDPPPAPPGEKAMEVDRCSSRCDDIAYIEEIQRPYRSQISIWDLHQRNIADKAARQCRGDIGVYILYRWLPPPRGCGCMWGKPQQAPTYYKPPLPPDELPDDASTAHRRPRQCRRRRDDADHREH